MDRLQRIKGFPPLVGAGAQVLILGSMPSVASLDKHEYYGKPQNAFWKIMGELYGAGPDISYTLRVNKLIKAGVAVWDVLASCVRPGSLDSAIDMSSAELNDLVGLLGEYSGIRHVFFNGRKAEQIFVARVATDVARLRPDMQYTSLPSTSPAMASLNFSDKLECWRALAC